jgi:hypothetical protein
MFGGRLKTGSMAQVAKYLLSKHEALSSNPSITYKKIKINIYEVIR